jgi:acetoin utilization deacetylase AcuC-like enzyme
MTLLITHSACLEHLTPPGHPERPERLRAIEHGLEHEKFMFLLRELCPRAELEIIALCHRREYIERIRTAVPQSRDKTWIFVLDSRLCLSKRSLSRFRGEADMHGRVASPASVVDDPWRS